MKVDVFSEEQEQHQTVLRRRRASVVTHALRGDHIFEFRNVSVALTAQARLNCANTSDSCPCGADLDSGGVWCVVVRADPWNAKYKIII
jgi:hypothetical protein